MTDTIVIYLMVIGVAAVVLIAVIVLFQFLLELKDRQHLKELANTSFESAQQSFKQNTDWSLKVFLM
jgi:NADH:ubiquinone oxidoreductase subunit 3 (subunit A)